MPESHSEWSASGFEKVMLCPGSKVLEVGQPNRSSKYSAEGTAAHQVLTWALQEKLPASAYVGRVLEVDDYAIEVTDDMAAHLQTTLDYVHDASGSDGEILADIRVCYASYLGLPSQKAWGTADVIVLKGDELLVLDLKFGQGVEVKAGDDERRKPNPQMALYGLGALAEYNGLAGEFTRVRLVISQPRLSVKPSEYDLSVEELEAWGRGAARSAVCSAINAAETCVTDDQGRPVPPNGNWRETFLRPGEKQCKFCRAKATCPALRDEVVSTVMHQAPASPDEFEGYVAKARGMGACATTLESVLACEKSQGHSAAAWLSAALGKVDLIEDWCKAVRAEVERRLLAGEDVPGFKLVEGKQGNRAWANAAEAEAMLKTFRLKQEQMYDFTLISPTTAEKLAPKVDKKTGKPKPDQGDTPIGIRQWTKLAALITRAPAKKHVAPADDPRPAITVQPVADEFNNVAPPGAEEFA